MRSGEGWSSVDHPARGRAPRSKLRRGCFQDIATYRYCQDIETSRACCDTVTPMSRDTGLINARSLAKLGLAVRTLRQRRTWSQAELAAKAQVSRQWIIALEGGQTEGMEIGRLMRVLDALDASLMLRDDDPKALL